MGLLYLLKYPVHYAYKCVARISLHCLVLWVKIMDVIITNADKHSFTHSQ